MFTRIRGLSRQNSCPKKKRKRNDKEGSVTVKIECESDVYYPGDTVTGKVTLTCNVPVTVTCFKATIRGVAKVHWCEVDGFIALPRHHKAYRDYIADTRVLLGSDGDSESRRSYKLSRGVHEYRFRFSLPSSGVSTSYEGKHGAVRYWIQTDLTITKSSTQKNKKLFTVVNPLDVNDEQYLYPVEEYAEKKVGCLPISSGKLRLSARTDRKGYCPGETIYISGEIENYCTQGVTPSATLLQIQTYMTQLKNKIRSVRMSTVTLSPVSAGTVSSWESHPFRVPALPPSINNCSIIKLEYVLCIALKISRRRSTSVDLPLVIGTIPYRPSFRATELPPVPPYSPPSNIGCPPPVYSDFLTDSEDGDFEPHYGIVLHSRFDHAPPAYSELDPFPKRRLKQWPYSIIETNVLESSDSETEDSSDICSCHKSLKTHRKLLNQKRKQLQHEREFSKIEHKSTSKFTKRYPIEKCKYASDESESESSLSDKSFMCIKLQHDDEEKFLKSSSELLQENKEVNASTSFDSATTPESFTTTRLLQPHLFQRNDKMQRSASVKSLWRPVSIYETRRTQPARRHSLFTAVVTIPPERIPFLNEVG